MRKLIRNAIRTPDGTILVSRFRHDYVTHVDKITGKEYMVDGGLAYQRSSANGDEVFLCVYDDDDHEIIREALEWGTYGKDGDQPLTFIKLKDMETSHIVQCVEKSIIAAPQIRKAMENEVLYRVERLRVT